MSDQNLFDEERISNTVLSFINAETWAESKAIVQTHQDDLLTPAATVELCQTALRLVDRNAQLEQWGIPELWGTLQVDLGNSFFQNPLGQRAENLESAIEHYNQALEVRTREAVPEDWAATQENLANAYVGRISGARAENIESAIEHYNQALEVHTREAFPADWAATQNNLAAAYRDRIRGDHAENIDLAIEHCNQALEVRTFDRFPADRRQTLRNLGNLHFAEQSWKNALAN